MPFPEAAPDCLPQAGPAGTCPRTQCQGAQPGLTLCPDCSKIYSSMAQSIEVAPPKSPCTQTRSRCQGTAARLLQLWVWQRAGAWKPKVGGVAWMLLPKPRLPPIRSFASLYRFPMSGCSLLSSLLFPLRLSLPALFWSPSFLSPFPSLFHSLSPFPLTPPPFPCPLLSPPSVFLSLPLSPWKSHTFSQTQKINMQAIPSATFALKTILLRARELAQW